MTKIQNFKMYIDGQWLDSESGKTIKSLNPENNEVWATVPEANEKDVDKAVQAAQKAFENSWATLHPRERAKYLRSLSNQLRENAEHLGAIETTDTGKLFRETKSQANYIAEYYDYFAGLADKVEGTVVPIDKPDMQVTTTRMPIGVVAAIIPWNSQMLLTAVKLAPALLDRNAPAVERALGRAVTALIEAKPDTEVRSSELESMIARVENIKLQSNESEIRASDLLEDEIEFVDLTESE